MSLYLVSLFFAVIAIKYCIIVSWCVLSAQASASQMRFFRGKRNGPNCLNPLTFSKSTSKCCFIQKHLRDKIFFFKKSPAEILFDALRIFHVQSFCGNDVTDVTFLCLVLLCSSGITSSLQPVPPQRKTI